MTVATTEEIAWAAGLFEGEGTINVENPPSRKKHGRFSPQAQMRLSMTDRDVVERFHNVVGVGNLHKPRDDKRGWKPLYTWALYKRSEIRHLIELFYPYLGERRRAKADEALSLGEASPPGERTHCPKGHPYAGDNLMEERIVRASGEYVARRCRTCRSAQERLRKREEMRRLRNTDPSRHRVSA